ncbi:MAG: cysteine desulfurase [bacterium]|nr:cysteine desulfurase [bacterium]
MQLIYLDHNATTPVDPEVVEAMLPHLTDDFGNASSVHQFGRSAKVALESARESIASFINCLPSELFFTSGGTESDNLAILGTATHFRGKKKHLGVAANEHHAVIESAEHLHHKEGFDLSLLPVDAEGFAHADQLRPLLREDSFLVSVMHANNETGTIQDLRPLADVAHEKNVLFHTDAVQSIGKVKVDVKALGVDMLSLTGHKIYGPKGTGALFIRQGIKISPLMYGGSHEKKRRPGTENVAGAVGLAKALEIAGKRMDTDFARMQELADYFLGKLETAIPDVKFNGPRSNRIPQTVNVSFKGTTGEPIILGLDMEGIAVASGSACTSGATEPSHVLTAMGIPANIANGAIRFSLGRSTTREQLDYVLRVLPPIVERLRAMSPEYNRT